MSISYCDCGSTHFRGEVCSYTYRNKYVGILETGPCEFIWCRSCGHMSMSYAIAKMLEQMKEDIIDTYLLFEREESRGLFIRTSGLAKYLNKDISIFRKNMIYNNLIYNVTVNKVKWWYIPSVVKFKKTGDGRLKLGESK